MLGLFCEPWEFTFIWNTSGVRNRQAIQSCFFSMCSAMQQNYCSDLQRLEVRALLGKKKGFAFRLQWGWKSRLGCLLLNLHYSFKFGVTGWISISFYLEHILCNNNLKSFLFTCSVSLKKKKKKHPICNMQHWYENTVSSSLDCPQLLNCRRSAG